MGKPPISSREALFVVIYPCPHLLPACRAERHCRPLSARRAAAPRRTLRISSAGSHCLANKQGGGRKRGKTKRKKRKRKEKKNKGKRRNKKIKKRKIEQEKREKKKKEGGEGKERERVFFTEGMVKHWNKIPGRPSWPQACGCSISICTTLDTWVHFSVAQCGVRSWTQ